MNDDPVIAKIKESKAFYKDTANGLPQKVPNFYEHVTKQAAIQGLWLEFGTGHGSTLYNICPYVPDTIYTFDWFRGLPEDWILSEEERYNRGAFGVAPTITNEMTQKKIDGVKEFILLHCDKAVIIDGLFADTLPEFINDHLDVVSFVHVDCDIYTSTKTILTYLDEALVGGSVILFDEFYNYPNYREHEYKAFMEYIKMSGFNYEPIAHVVDGRQAAFRLT